MELIAAIIVLILLAIYFAPAICAVRRYHPNSGLIFLFNLIFGWSVVGWICCFIWAYSDKWKTAIVNNTPTITPRPTVINNIYYSGNPTENKNNETGKA